MLVADYIAIGALVVFALLGFLVGFGKGLKFFTSGIFGVIISVFVTYLLFGLVYDLSFVKELLDKFNNWLREQGDVGTFFADIYTDRIVLAVAIFIIVQIVRVIIVKIIKSIVEIDNVVFKIINKTLGLVFFVAVLAALVLIVFQIIAWIGGETAQNFANQLKDSVIGLDWLFENNPLNSIFRATGAAAV